jgi:hypothetical protein
MSAITERGEFTESEPGRAGLFLYLLDFQWCAWQESNLRPSAQKCALPLRDTIRQSDTE